MNLAKTCQRMGPRPRQAAENNSQGPRHVSIGHGCAAAVAAARAHSLPITKTHGALHSARRGAFSSLMRGVTRRAPISLLHSAAVRDAAPDHASSPAAMPISTGPGASRAETRPPASQVKPDCLLPAVLTMQATPLVRLQSSAVVCQGDARCRLGGCGACRATEHHDIMTRVRQRQISAHKRKQADRPAAAAGKAAGSSTASVGSTTARSPANGEARVPSGRSSFAMPMRSPSSHAAENVAAVATCAQCTSHICTRLAQAEMV